MAKRKYKKTFLFGTLMTSASLFLPISVSSCKSEPVAPHDSEIRVFNKQQVVKQHSFVVPFSISNMPLSPVSVQIIDEDTGYLSISTQQIFLESENGKIDFAIDPSVVSSTDFHFGVEFLFIDSANKFQTIQVNDLSVYYVDDPIEPVDDVVPKDRTVYKINSHTFNFTMNVYKHPSSEKALVHLVDNPTGAIIMDDMECTFWQVPGHTIYYIDIPVQISLTEHRTAEHPFTLEITFTNSFGVKQKTLVTDLNAFFVSDPQETIPVDYYNISKQVVNGEEQNVLLGLKPEISREEAGRYSRMVLPNTVTHIAPGAFIDRKWFQRIEYIKLGANTKSIGEQAFVGCTHAFEFDVSTCKNTSSFLDEPSILFGNLDYEFGFVWFNDTDDMSESMNKLKRKGVPSNWSNGRESQIVPDAFYKFDPNEPTKLIGIHDDSATHLFKYSIIRLPEKTTKIEANALDEFGKKPFRPSPEERELRQLLIGRQVTELHCLPKGIGGHVTFRCSELTKLEPDLAKDITKYPDRSLPFGNISFDLSPMNRLVEIGERAFSGAHIVGTFFIPPSVRKIGDEALSKTLINRLIFSYPLCQNAPEESIGVGAFAKMIEAEEIDFSVYTSLPDWLTREDLNLFDIHNTAAKDAIIWLNKKTSDKNLDSWKQNLTKCHSAPIKDVYEQLAEHYWSVEKNPY